MTNDETRMTKEPQMTKPDDSLLPAAHRPPPTAHCPLPAASRPLCFIAVAALVLLHRLALGASPPGGPVPVVFDTDIGDDIDDTWALAMLLKSPGLDLKLVTTTCGKAEYRAKLIAKLLTAAGRTDVPVGLGAGGREGTGGQQAWVKDYRLSDYPGKVYQDGVAALVDLVENSPRPVTVVSVGPLHTLAAALARCPDLPAKAEFVGMDGSLRVGYGGSSKPSVEYNVAANVPAAQAVFKAAWRRATITPLDTCGLVTLDGQRFAALKGSDDLLVRAVLENYRIWSGKKQVAELTGSSVLFDTVGVYLAYPGDRPLVRLETLPVAVTADGFTRIDPRGRKISAATAWTSLDGYRDLLVRTLLRSTTPR
jgi:inosine-uridine nucleoside N-ribohydrolase